MAISRTSVNVLYAFQLNGSSPVSVRNFSGLSISSTLVDGAISAPKRQRKIASLTYSEVTVEFDIPLPENVFQLFKDILSGTAVTGTASIIELNTLMKHVRTFELGDCKVTEVSFPSVDATSKEKGFASVTLQPQRVDLIPSNKSTISIPAGQRNLAFIRSNFRISIDGLSTFLVRSISPIAMSPHFTNASTVPGVIDFIEYKAFQVKVNESEIDKAEWQKWLKEFVRNEQEEGKNATLTFLAPNLKTTLFEVDLTHLLIISAIFGDSEPIGETPIVKLEFSFDAARITSNGQK